QGRFFPLYQCVGARLSVVSARRTMASGYRMRDKVSRQQYNVGVERPEHLERALHPVFPHERAKVNVANLGDAETVKIVREAVQLDIDALRQGMLRLNKKRVPCPHESQACRSPNGSPQELSAGKFARHL